MNGYVILAFILVAIAGVLIYCIKTGPGKIMDYEKEVAEKIAEAAREAEQKDHSIQKEPGNK